MKKISRWAPGWLLPLALMTLALGTGASAQETGTITGSVMRADGGPLIGAQVVIPDLRIGSLTNAQGRFTLSNVPTGTRVVQVTRLGFTSAQQEAIVGAGQTATLSFILSESAIELDGVVVTALGINREERALGYSVQGVSGDALNESREPNVVSALAGKVAGVQIKNVGPLGGTSTIILRGYSSISGSNQPLFVVDGVPIDNTIIRSNSGVGTGGRQDYGNTASDINPDDIESLTVLKGANAAALYGSRAANGVILITTKRGRGASGLGISASTNLTFDTPSRTPRFQTMYGAGTLNTDYNWVDGRGAGLQDGVDESWGVPMDGRIISQWNGTYPYLPKAYSVRQFYTTGTQLTNNVSVSSAFDRGSIRFSASQLNATGTVPNQELTRTTGSLASNYAVSDRLTLDGGLTYTRNYGYNRPTLQETMFYWWDVSVNTWDLKQAMNGFDPASGRAPNWNHNYWDNPYFYQQYRTNSDTRNRLNGYAMANYRFNDWLSAQGRIGTDWYHFGRDVANPKNSDMSPLGYFLEASDFIQETNSDFLVSFEPQINEVFSFSARGGGNVRINSGEKSEVSSGRLNVDGIYNPSNSGVPPTILQEMSRKQVNSLYGFATFGFNNYFFVDITGRNDWSSTLPEGNNSYFYPSVSSSLVLTDIFELPEVLSYGKIRASWAKVGNDADPYQLAATSNLYTPTFGGQVAYTTDNSLPNINLSPEETISWEVGAEARIGRAVLDLTYYDSKTVDQILPVSISGTTGYTSIILNAGEVANRGIEAVLSGDLYTSGDFTWAASVNFARNESEVLKLHEDLQTINLNGSTIQARLGYPYGSFFVNKFQRNENGDILVGADGRPLRYADPEVIGSFQPDWTGGFENILRFRDVSFSFLIDHRNGGLIQCLTCQLGNGDGVLYESSVDRDNLVFPGVFGPGTPKEGQPNDVAFPNARTLWGSTGWRRSPETFIYDATWTKLREIKLSFRLPDRLVEALPITSGNVNLVARNLAMWTRVPHIDPEVTGSTGNGPGIENYQLPSPRSVSLTFSVTN